MTSDRTLSIFLLSILLTTVNSQQNVVSVNTIQDGGSFMVYCDASRVIIPSSVTVIDTLRLSRQVGNDQTPTLIAQYKSFPVPGVNSEYRNIPSLRHWNITFSGENVTNNKNTIKIEMLVNDAVCNDAGLYVCQVTYYAGTGGTTATTERSQNVTSESAAKFFTFIPNPDNRLLDSENPDYSEYKEGDFVTITCRVDGPQDLRFSWYQRSEDGFGNGFYAPYPYTNDITTPAAVPKPGSTCNEYMHQSTLSLNLTILNDQMTYKCAVDDNGQEIISGNTTIGVGSTPNINVPDTAGSVSWLNLVSVNTTQDGGSFMVYCDAQRVNIPSYVTAIDSLKLSRQVGFAQTPTVIAMYKSFTPNCVTPVYQNIPFSREWNIIFSGSNGGFNNINTMKIEMSVPDALYSDAGLYICEVSFYTGTTGTTTTREATQFVTPEMNSQPNVMSINTIQDGGSFMVYCDASRVTIPRNVTIIDSLKLSRQVGIAQSPTVIALYRSVAPAGVNSEFQNIPSSRMWNITFSGSNGGNNNRNTMKIEMFVAEALCSDAGSYICEVSYYIGTSGITDTSETRQIVTSELGSQLNVVSVKTVQNGGGFMVYCDAKRVTIPSNVTVIDSLKLSRQVGFAQTPTLVAEYKSCAPGAITPEYQNIPSSRQWIITFSGSNGGSNNRNTMKIEMSIPDALCSDAGLYICEVSYYTGTTGGTDTSVSRQDVTCE